MFTPDGTAVVVWWQAGDLYAAVRPPAGPFSAPAPIFDMAGEAVSFDDFVLAAGGPGQAMVAFVTGTSPFATGTATLRSILRTSTGWEAPQVVAQDSGDTSGDCTRTANFLSVALDMDASGNAAVAAKGSRNSQEAQPGGCGGGEEASNRIVAARRSHLGGSWSAPTELDPSVALSLSSLRGVDSPDVVFSSQGEAVLAWAYQTENGLNSMRYAAGPSASAGFGSAADVPGSTGGVGFTSLVPLAGGGTLLGFLGDTATEVSFDAAVRPAGGTFGSSTPVSQLSNVVFGLELAATPAGDVVAAMLQDEGSGDVRAQSLIYDASPPLVGDVNVPANGAPGQELAMSASATDAFSPVSFVWTLGDGAGAVGAQLTHAYASSGSFDVRVTAGDAAGNAAAPAARTVTVSQPDGPGPGAGPELVGPIELANKVIRAAARGESALPTARRRRKPIGTRVTFRLSEAASVAFKVERARPGRRVARRCVRPTRRNRKRRRCTRYVLQRGSFTVAGAAGETHFRFTGRLRGRKLRPGRYRLVAVATDGDGNRSAAKRAGFRVVG